MKSLWLKLFVSVFNVGFIPYAPGTFGSLAALPLILFLTMKTSVVFYIIFVLILFVFSVFIIDAYEKKMGTHDSKIIVIDEVLGMLVAFFLVPISLTHILLGFVIFRFFDILKPFPINHLDRKVKGGFGVIVDDVVAGLFTNICMHFLITRLI
jgi:phosphatidylglycerophosphatase A